MNLKNVYINTFMPQLPKIINNNFSEVKKYMDNFYDENQNIIIKPVNTTGRVKATTGQFVNAVVNNLTVKNQYTNLYENITTIDSDFISVYNNDSVDTRIATDSSIWPYEDSYYNWIDIQKPYYKISNENPIGLQNDNIGQVVRFVFDSSVNPANNFEILLDPCLNKTFEISHIDASSSYLELITINYDASWGPTWAPYRFGYLDESNSKTPLNDQGTTSGTISLDMSQNRRDKITLSGDVTFNLSNIPVNYSTTYKIDINTTMSDKVVNWDSNLTTDNWVDGNELSSIDPSVHAYVVTINTNGSSYNDILMSWVQKGS